MGGGVTTTEEGTGGEPGESMQDQFENDPQAFLKRMAAMSNGGGGGSCPMMGTKYFDPFNEESLEYGYDCAFKSRWAFLLEHKGRLTTRKFRS